MTLHPQELSGNWTKGFALDLHTSSSHPIREIKTVKMVIDGVERDVQVEGDIIGWDTKRPEIAEELYRLKYWKEEYRAGTIAQHAADFLKPYLTQWQLSCIIPIPPSDTTRAFQPVYKIAEGMGKICNLHVSYDILKKVKSTSELKSIEDPEQRKVILDGAFDTNKDCLLNKNILLFDDLYRSGETLRAASTILKSKGGVRNVYVLTITKTRAKR